MKRGIPYKVRLILTVLMILCLVQIVSAGSTPTSEGDSDNMIEPDVYWDGVTTDADRTPRGYWIAVDDRGYEYNPAGEGTHFFGTVGITLAGSQTLGSVYSTLAPTTGSASAGLRKWSITLPDIYNNFDIAGSGHEIEHIRLERKNFAVERLVEVANFIPQMGQMTQAAKI